MAAEQPCAECFTELVKAGLVTRKCERKRSSLDVQKHWIRRYAIHGELQRKSTLSDQ
jgi:hypothetical protein